MEAEKQEPVGGSPAALFSMQTGERSWHPGPGNASAYVLESSPSAPPPNQPAAITGDKWPRSSSGDHHADDVHAPPSTLPDDHCGVCAAGAFRHGGSGACTRDVPITITRRVGALHTPTAARRDRPRPATQSLLHRIRIAHRR